MLIRPRLRSARLRAGAGAAAQPARAAARHGPGARGPRVHRAALSFASLRASADRDVRHRSVRCTLEEVAAFHRGDVHAVAPDRRRRPATRRTTRSRALVEARVRRLVRRGRRAMPSSIRARSPLRAPPVERLAVLAPARRGAIGAAHRARRRARARTPDYHALLVLNMVLGGQFVSRINMNLREDKGYTYGARTVVRVPPRPWPVRAARERAVRRHRRRHARSDSASCAAIRGDRPVTRAGARDRARGPDARLSPQFRNRGANQPRRRATGAVRSA